MPTTAWTVLSTALNPKDPTTVLVNVRSGSRFLTGIAVHPDDLDTTDWSALWTSGARIAPRPVTGADPAARLMALVALPAPSR